MGKHRKKYKIVADILNVAKDGAKKTHIMYRANLSFGLMNQYLKKVITLGLVNQVEDEYLLTNNGVRFLDVFSDYEEHCKKLSSYSDRLAQMRSMLEDILKGRVEL